MGAVEEGGGADLTDFFRKSGHCEDNQAAHWRQKEKSGRRLSEVGAP